MRPTKPRRHAALLAVVCLASAPAGADEQPRALHPVASEAAAKLSGSAGPFVMVVQLQALKGRGDDLVEALATPRRETAKEAGNLEYALSREAADPDRFVLYERWLDVEALDEHLKQPYLVELLAAFERLLVEPPTVTVLRPVADP